MCKMKTPKCTACGLSVMEGDPKITMPYQDDPEWMVRHATQMDCNAAREREGIAPKAILKSSRRRGGRWKGYQ